MDIADNVERIDDLVEITPQVLLSRQAELVPAQIENVRIAIVGVGGIGSNVFATVARIGARNFTLYDGDDVEAANVHPGAFTMDDVGQPKTQAMVRRMQQELGVELNVRDRGWFDMKESHDYHDVWVIGTDNMRSRVDVWNAVHELALYDLFVDARMGGAGYEMYTVRSRDERSALMYERDNLVNIEDQDLPCGQKATAFITREIASQVVGRIRAYLTGTIESVPTALLFDWDTFVRGTS